MNAIDRALPAVGRLLISALFLMSGFGKLAAPSATKAYIASAGMPYPELAYWGAILVEVVVVSVSREMNRGGASRLIGVDPREIAAKVQRFKNEEAASGNNPRTTSSSSQTSEAGRTLAEGLVRRRSLRMWCRTKVGMPFCMRM